MSFGFWAAHKWQICCSWIANICRFSSVTNCIVAKLLSLLIITQRISCLQDVFCSFKICYSFHEHLSNRVIDWPLYLGMPQMSCCQIFLIPLKAFWLQPSLTALQHKIPLGDEEFDERHVCLDCPSRTNQSLRYWFRACRAAFQTLIDPFDKLEGFLCWFAVKPQIGTLTGQTLLPSCRVLSSNPNIV